MEIDYAVVRHDHHPKRWRWWCGVHEIAAGPDGAVNWSENPVALVAHRDEGGPEALEADLGRILAAVAAAPVFSTTTLMAPRGRAFDRYGGVGGPGCPGTPANDDEAPGRTRKGRRRSRPPGRPDPSGWPAGTINVDRAPTGQPSAA